MESNTALGLLFLSAVLFFAAWVAFRGGDDNE